MLGESLKEKGGRKGRPGRLFAVFFSLYLFGRR